MNCIKFTTNYEKKLYGVSLKRFNISYDVYNKLENTTIKKFFNNSFFMYKLYAKDSFINNYNIKYMFK